MAEVTANTEFNDLDSSVEMLQQIQSLASQVEHYEREREIQNAVFRIADIAASSEDMGDFYGSLHEIVTDLTSTDAFFVAIYHEQENCISFPYYEDEYDDEQEAESTPLRNRGLIPVEQLSHSLTWRVLQNNSVVRVEDIANSGLSAFGKLAQDWLGVPLQRDDGKPIGVCAIQSYVEGFRYTDAEVELMGFMSRHIATAVQRRRDAFSLKKAHDDLQATAAQLATANEALKKQIDEREEISDRMLALSHQAGKAEVATGVLHNVGNVLNSINVSAHLVRDLHRKSRLPSLRRAIDLVHEQSDPGAFLSLDPRGKQLPGFIGELTTCLEGEVHESLKELEKLIEHLEHVKVVVAMQQSFAGVSGLKKPVCIAKLFDDAEILLSDSMYRHEINVIHEFSGLPNEIMIERQKLLQVVVNLLKNAKDSLIEGRQDGRKMTIRAGKVGSNLKIEIDDNGVGIRTEDLTRIFSHGFTTKSNGHGFGLHSCANTIGSMGGKLTARSDGPGKGATFTMVLPFVDANDETKSNAGSLNE